MDIKSLLGLTKTVILLLKQEIYCLDKLITKYFSINFIYKLRINLCVGMMKSIRKTDNKGQISLKISL